MNWIKLLFIGIVGFGIFQHFSETPVKHGAGVLAPDEPVQSSLDAVHAQTLNGYQIVPLANFEIKARVLSREDYSLGREAELSPVDFALGWGRMSDETVLNEIYISQSNRFYYWRVNNFPIPREEIETHSANMHMIPADRLVEERLESVRVGQVVRLNGYLIEAKTPDGWRWRSSLTRNDTGYGACELLLVKRIEVM